MFGKILVGIDDRVQSRDAAALGRSLAELTGATVVLATALPYDQSHIGLEAFRQFLRRDSEARFATVRPELGSLELGTRALGGSGAARALHELAEAEGADLIVLGSTHRGKLGRVLPGSVGERLLSAAPCAVAVAPRGHAQRARQIRRIAVGYDGEEESKAALRVAEQMVRRGGAGLKLVTAFQPPGVIEGYNAYLSDPAREYQQRLDEGLRSLSSDVAAEGLLVEAFDRDRNVMDVAAALLEEAGNDVDLLIIGSRGYGPLRRVLLGGVSAKLMRTARWPVLVVPRGVAAHGEKRGEVAAEQREGLH